MKKLIGALLALVLGAVLALGGYAVGAGSRKSDAEIRQAVATARTQAQQAAEKTWTVRIRQAVADTVAEDAEKASNKARSEYQRGLKAGRKKALADIADAQKESQEHFPAALEEQCRNLKEGKEAGDETSVAEYENLNCAQVLGEVN